MTGAVDLERVTAEKRAVNAKNRANVYAQAAEMMRLHSGLCIGSGEKLSYQILVKQCLELSKEFYNQVHAMDVEFIKEQEKESGTSKSTIVTN